MQEAKKEEVLEEVLEDLEKESQADQTEDSLLDKPGQIASPVPVGQDPVKEEEGCLYPQGLEKGLVQLIAFVHR